jgi:hypothetical protein
MSDDRTDKQRPQEQIEPEQEPHAAHAPRRDEHERKPSRIERREWRGSGVCGDRHTD